MENGYALKEPPDYTDGDEIRIYYDVHNAGCGAVSIKVELTGSVSGATIHNADQAADACLTECSIAAGELHYGDLGWNLAKHPTVSGERVVATVSVLSPGDFGDIDAANDTAISEAGINVVREPSEYVDLALASVAVAPDTATPAGAAVEFTAVVTNKGTSAAAPSLQVSAGNSDEPVATSTLALMPPGKSLTEVLRWDTSGYAAGEYDVAVLLSAADDVSASDNAWTGRVTLREPVVDIRIGPVSAAPTPALAGAPVTLAATVSNHGDFAATPVVRLAVGTSTTTAAFLMVEEISPGAERDISLVWDTAGQPAGNHQLTVSVWPDGTASEPAASAAVSAFLYRQVDLAVSSISIAGAAPRLGETATIAVTVANVGDNPVAGGLLELTIRGEDEPAATSTISSLGPGDTQSFNLQWDTTGNTYGQYDLDATVSVTAETDSDGVASNDTRSVAMVLRNWLSLRRITPRQDTAIVGDALPVSAEITNHAAAGIANVALNLYRGNDDVPLAVSEAISIAGGSAKTVTVRWTPGPSDVGSNELSVWISSPAFDPDEDDGAPVAAQVSNEIVLAGARQEPADAMAGDAVTILLGLENVSTVSVATTSVRLLAVATGQDIGAVAVGPLAPGQTATTSIVWMTAGAAAGTHQLRARQTIPGRAADADDVINVAVSLREPVVDGAVTEVALPRAIAVIGQAVSIAATVANNGERAVAIPVRLNIGGAAQPVATTTSPMLAPGSITSVSLTWDTAGFSVGEHQLRVATAMAQDANAANDGQSASVNLFRTAFTPGGPIRQCADDLAVNVSGITDDTGGPVADAPYDSYDTLTVSYEIYNYSCNRDVTALLALAGSLTGAGIDDSSDECLSGCAIPYGGMMAVTAQWALAGHPGVAGESVAAAVSAKSPDDFTDANSGNNASVSVESVDIVGRADVMVRVGQSDARRGLIAGPLRLDDFDADYGDACGDDAGAALCAVSVWASEITAGSGVRVSAFVRNRGNSAINIPVNLLVNDARRPVDSVTANDLAPGTIGRVDLFWHVPAGTTAGEYNLTVALASADTESDDRAAITNAVTVKKPAPGAKIIRATATPQRALSGAPVTISVDVQNTGALPARIPVKLFVGRAKSPYRELQTAELQPGETGAVSFTWAQSAGPGNYFVRVQVLDSHRWLAVRYREPGARVADDELLMMSVAPAPAYLGQVVAVSLTVFNSAAQRASIPLTLDFPGDGRRDATRNPSVGPNESVTRSIQWRTGALAAGEHTLRANAVIGGRTITVTQTVELLVDAEIVSVTSRPSEPAALGRPVDITVAVRNNGPVAVNIPVILHFPSPGKQPERRSPRVPAGESETVTFIWRTSRYDAGGHSFRVTLGTSDAPLDSRVFNLQLLPAQDVESLLDVEIVSITSNPPDAAVRGQPVDIMVAVRNNGPAAVNVPVILHFPSPDKQPERRSPRVQAGEDAVARFTWRTSRYQAGAHFFRVTLGASDAPLESRVFELQLLPPAVDFSVQSIAVGGVAGPFAKGEWVFIAARVANLGEWGGSGRIILRNLSYGNDLYGRSMHLEPGESKTVEFVWKTLRYRVGRHEIQVYADAPNDAAPGNDVSGVAVVNVLPADDITVGAGAVVFGTPTQPSGAMLAGLAVSDSDAIYEPAGAIGALYRRARTSAIHCARLQRRLGHPQPRAALCPAAPSLVR